MGSSMAENHPVGFQWVIEARKRGATIIHVDPRFTRTSAMSDIWVPMRSGSDIVFLGGLIHYVLEHGKEFREYVKHYTNAATILRDDIKLPDQKRRVRFAMPLDGLSTRPGYRSSAPPAYFNSYWETLDGREGEFLLSADTRAFRDPPIFLRCTTLYPATCQCHFGTATRIRSDNTSSAIAATQDGGATSTNTSSVS